MKNKILRSLVIGSLALLFAFNAWSQITVCPNTPLYYYPQPSAPTACCGIYDDGSYAINSKNASGVLTVIWPHEGHGYVLFEDIGVVIHLQTTITSGFAFTSVPQLLCNNQTGTVTIVDNCSTSFYWAAPSGWSINGGGNTLSTTSKSISVKAPAAGSGNFQITVTPNLSSIRNTNIWVGAYGSGNVTWVIPNSPLCRNQYYYPTANALPGATYYDWVTTSGWYVSGQGSRYLTIRPPSTGGGMIGLRVNNVCGTGGVYKIQNYTVISCGGYSAVVSPNPVSSELSIELMEIDTNENVSIEEVKLFDEKGSLVREKKEKGRKVKINVQGLPNGEYYLNVLVNGEVSKHRIIID